LYSKMIVGYLRGLMARQKAALTAARVVGQGEVPRHGVLGDFSDRRDRAKALIDSIRHAVEDSEYFSNTDQAILKWFFLETGDQEARLRNAADEAGVKKTAPKNSLGDVLERFGEYLSSDQLRRRLGDAPTGPGGQASKALTKVIEGPPDSGSTASDGELATLSIAVPEATQHLGVLFASIDPIWMEAVVRAECPAGLTIVLPGSGLSFEYAHAYDAVIGAADSVVFCQSADSERDAGWCRYARARANTAGKPFESVTLTPQGALA
jgi:hypothetical protein